MATSVKLEGKGMLPWQTLQGRVRAHLSREVLQYPVVAYAVLHT
jgi:hypothetical protein